ncbi:MAG TPA: SDR family oxidoreductase [Bacteroidia bacterium]|nr:NAD-dependent epimerase/dehydratase family protein [Sphingobacteriales bacterium]HPD65149.1 SDR family oxidoreductase [Bacteroidia bacterium]HRS58690.1 SDR family oxidoreductase [Bacteroidia bacterium]HRU68313.1 SDR family oxidoreductase [Bacteroidia bacterium]
MILITGASGFAGSYILYELFRRQKKVRVFKRPDSSFRQIEFVFRLMNQDKELTFNDYINYFDWADGNLDDRESIEEAISGITEIIHCAAIVSFAKPDKNKILNINYRATAHLVNLAIEKGISKFHYLSSIASLDRNNDNTVREENFPVTKKFSSTYSQSKYLGEMEVWRGYQEGLTGIILNPGVITGPMAEDKPTLKLINVIRKGFKFYPVGTNGYVDVRDVAGTFVQLIDSEEFYNQRYICVSENLSYREIFAMVAVHSGVKAPSIRATRWMTITAMILDHIRAVFTGDHALFKLELVKLINSHYFYDNTKIRNTLGYQFMPINQSIHDMIKYSINP